MGLLLETDIARAAAQVKQVQQALGTVLLGQEVVIELALTGIFARGHILLESFTSRSIVEVIQTTNPLTLNKLPPTLSPKSATTPQ